MTERYCFNPPRGCLLRPGKSALTETGGKKGGGRGGTERHNTNLSFYRWAKPAEKANRFTFTSSDSGTASASLRGWRERVRSVEVRGMIDKQWRLEGKWRSFQRQRGVSSAQQTDRW